MLKALLHPGSGHGRSLGHCTPQGQRAAKIKFRGREKTWSYQPASPHKWTECQEHKQVGPKPRQQQGPSESFRECSRNRKEKRKISSREGNQVGNWEDGGWGRRKGWTDRLRETDWSFINYATGMLGLKT